MEAPSTNYKLQKQPSSSSSSALDEEGKSTIFRPFSLRPSPHMVSFHMAWLSLFSNFFSTFSIPPLLSLIRRDLSLTDVDVGRANAAAFAGSVLSRLSMGPACDLLGPRAASASLSLLTAPAVLSVAASSSPLSFSLSRLAAGLSLANFVASQFWMTSMFSPSVVALANAVAAGWANVGSGLAQLLMPLIFSLLNNRLALSPSAAWRLSFLVPATFQATTAMLVLVFAKDKPFINTKKPQPNDERTFFSVVLNGLRNYRAWILALTYGFCFGVELTTDSIIAQYFFDRFLVDIKVAGCIAASFGVSNVFARPLGGKASDEMGRRFGMRGRLWGLWAVQTVAGLMCVWLGQVGSLGGSVAVMCGFSVFVQAASGLTFGVVPFVSKRSLGVVSGMTGSGGTVGAVITQLLLFSGSKFSTQTSISLMGLLMIVCTIPITFIYFPQWGGMFCGPSHDFDFETIHYHLLA